MLSEEGFSAGEKGRSICIGSEPQADNKTAVKSASVARTRDTMNADVSMELVMKRLLACALISFAFPLSAYAGSFTDSLYGEFTVTVNGDHLELQRGEARGALRYWNASTFRWETAVSSVTGPLFIKFDVAPDNTVGGMYFGLAGDMALIGRKVSGRGGRGGRGGPPMR